MSQLLTQKRARYALEVIQRVKDSQDKKAAAAFGRHVRRLPEMVQHNGLGQALAFLLADDAGGINGKADSNGRWSAKEHTVTPAGRAYWDLETWLCGPREPERHPRRVYPQEPFYREVGTGRDKKGSWQAQLITQVMAADRQQYFEAQQEALALLHWMKRFADAYLPKED